MSKIQWTNKTWNPLRARALDGTGKVGWACVRVSPGCVNCYAATQNRQKWAGGTGLDYTVPALAKVETYLDEKTLDAPLHWRKARRVFVCSMTDLFGDWVTDSEIAEVFGVMARAKQHTFQVLTKRPERMRHWITNVVHFTEGLPNVWLGTSVEDQQRANERIPHLVATPAAVRFLSCEPLLGPVSIAEDHMMDLDWVIVGGESGPRARPMKLEWARSLVAQCRTAPVAAFVKQLGTRPEFADGHETVRRVVPLKLRDRKGGVMTEWPDDLRVRQWPVTA